MLYYVRKYENQPKIDTDEWIKDDLFDDVMYKTSQVKYPLVNIGTLGSTLVIEIALAGYKKNNIKVSYAGNVISVSAKWEEIVKLSSENSSNCNCTCNSKTVEYLEQNINNTDVERKFYLANAYLGGTVKWDYVDGMLLIAVYPNEETHEIHAIEESDNLFTQQQCNCECCSEQNGD